MQLGWFVKLKSVSYSLFLHAVAVILLVISFDFTDPIKPHHQNINIVNAVTVDQAQVEKELQRLKQEDDKQKQAEKQRLAELEKKAEAEKKKSEEIKKQRLEEEKKLTETRKKKEQEQKQREEEQKKLEELAAQNKLEEEKKAQADAEQKKKEAELKKQEEERQQAGAEKKRQEDEKALLEELEAEQNAEQQQQDLTLQQQIIAAIYKKVINNFNSIGLTEGLSCTLRVKLIPGGEVLDVSIVDSSGNDIFDRRALVAVKKSSPLPVPDDAETFDRLDFRDFTFKFKL